MMQNFFAFCCSFRGNVFSFIEKVNLLLSQMGLKEKKIVAFEVNHFVERLCKLNLIYGFGKLFIEFL